MTKPLPRPAEWAKIAWLPLYKVEMTAELLATIVREENGRLYWQDRDDRYFADAGARLRYERNFAGRATHEATSANGYKFVIIAKRRWDVHRVVWTLANGRLPLGIIDHIDRDVTNNRADNLRELSPTESNLNRKLSHLNKSGVAGVYFAEHGKRWTARLRLNGRNVLNASFKTMDEAIAARLEAERQYGVDHLTFNRVHHSASDLAKWKALANPLPAAPTFLAAGAPEAGSLPHSGTGLGRCLITSSHVSEIPRGH